MSEKGTPLVFAASYHKLPDAEAGHEAIKASHYLAAASQRRWAGEQDR